MLIQENVDDETFSPPEKKQKIDDEISDYNLRELINAHTKLIKYYSECKYQKNKVSLFKTKMQVCNGGMQTYVSCFVCNIQELKSQAHSSSGM